MLPIEITSLKQWVCVKADSKIPLTHDLKSAASSSNPKTWSSYDDAAKTVQDKLASHVGFVFHNNGIVGIDIDNGFTSIGLPTEVCSDIVKQCHSYTERSRSGRGVHILVKGQLPFSGRNNQNGVEIYQDKRYFICTGSRYIYADLIENQKAIDYVLSKYFDVDRASSENNYNNRLYQQQFSIPSEHCIQLRSHYCEIQNGGRNQALTSLAGQLWTAGYDREMLELEIARANEQSCKPPLDNHEIAQICNSISKYRRD